MLVSKSEAARLAGVSRQTIHRKVSQGELSATDGMIDTSELIRVFGEIRDADSVTDDASQPVTRPSRGNSNVQVQLQARVDSLETELAVTREQLRDTATDRDEWREMAKSANENVKLLTDQSGKGGSVNSNMMMIFAIGAILVVVLVLGLTGNLGGAAPGSTEQPPTETMPAAVETTTSIPVASEPAVEPVPASIAPTEDAVTPEAEPEQVDQYAEETDPYAW